MPRDASLQQICAQAHPEEEFEVTLEGVVASFCDPETYPTPEEVGTLTDQGCYVVVGIHPKKDFGEDDCHRLAELLELPEVRGLGEIGVDHTVSEEQWPTQTENIERAIRAIGVPELLVLHCRGMKDKDNSEA